MANQVLDYLKFKNQFESIDDWQKWPDCLLVHGSEDYLIKKSIQLFKSKIQPDNREFNWSEFDFVKAPIENIFDQIKSYPFMSDFRVIEIENFLIAPLSKQQAFIEALNQIQDLQFVKIIFNETAAELKKKQVSLSKVKHLFYEVQCKTPYSNQIPMWIKQMANFYGVTLNQDVIALIHKRLGDQLSLVDNEIQKLALHPKALLSQELLVSDVDNMISYSDEGQIFEWVQNFFSKKRLLTEVQMNGLFDSGQSPQLMISLLARHARILAKIYEGKNKNLDGPQLSAYAKVPPYFLKNYLSDLRRWSLSELDYLLVQLAELDFLLKSQNQRPAIVFTNLIYKSLPVI